MDAEPSSPVNGVTPALSVVVPFLDEGPNVAPLLAELRTTLDGLGIGTEAVAVDDGSRDGTAAALAGAAAGWPGLRVITFPENRGQAAALLAGFAASRAPWIAMLDGDGQNPPAELARLWAAREGVDFVLGRRVDRRDSALRRAMSAVANAARRALLRDSAQDTGCSLKLFRREVASSFLPLRTMYSFLPAFAAWDGWRMREVPVAHRPRTAGASKYGLLVMAWRPLLDLLALAWLLRRRLPREVRPDPAGASRKPGQP
jgi:dolichol-phosphate mannosyltransferase